MLKTSPFSLSLSNRVRIWCTVWSVLVFLFTCWYIYFFSNENLNVLSSSSSLSSSLSSSTSSVSLLNDHIDVIKSLHSLSSSSSLPSSLSSASSSYSDYNSDPNYNYNSNSNSSFIPISLTNNIEWQYQGNYYNATYLRTQCKNHTKQWKCIDALLQLRKQEPKFNPSIYADPKRQTCRLNQSHLFHTFYVDPDLQTRPILELFVWSFLATQNVCTKLIIWTQCLDNTTASRQEQEIQSHLFRMIESLLFYSSLPSSSSSSSSHSYSRTCSKLKDGWKLRIEVKCYNPLKWFPQLADAYRGMDPIASSDFVRVTVCWKYGGIYLDLDTILLRDFYSLWGHAFAYPWSFTKRINTAAMSFGINNTNLTNKIVQAIVSTGDPLSSSHPQSLQQLLSKHGFFMDVLPLMMFDPYWLYADGFNDPSYFSDKYPMPYGKKLTGARSPFDVFFEEKLEEYNIFPPRTFLPDIFPGSFSIHVHCYSRRRGVPRRSLAGIMLHKCQDIFLSIYCDS